MKLVRPVGTIVEHGHFTYRGTIAVDLTPIVLKDLHIFGNLGYYTVRSLIKATDYPPTAQSGGEPEEGWRSTPLGRVPAPQAWVRGEGERLPLPVQARRPSPRTKRSGRICSLTSGPLSNSGFATAVTILGAQTGRVPFESLVTHEFPLSQAHEALETGRREECVKAVLAPNLG